MNAKMFGKRSHFALFLAGVLAWVGTAAAEISSGEKGILLEGAGATFPAPLYKKWIDAYTKIGRTSGSITSAVGSGEGIKRFIAREVDFAASDAAMSDEQIAGVREGVKLVPATAGLIALAYNLPGLTEPLNFSRDVYVDVLLGKIRRWDDPRIKASNPGLRLAEAGYRPGSYARTAAARPMRFTNHLSAIERCLARPRSGYG